MIRSTSQKPIAVTHISATTTHTALNLSELWQYRNMFFQLIRQNLATRYVQSVIGPGWALVNPLIKLFMYSAVFGVFIQVPSDNIEYPLFAYAALLPWGYFTAAMMGTVNCLLSWQSLVTKVYFPRLMLPLLAITIPLIDFLLASLVMVGLLLIYQVPLSPRLLALPFFLLLAALTALGVGLWLSIWQARYRDVSIGLGFLTQFLLYLTPIIYPVSLVPEVLQGLYKFNPLYSFVEGFRWALLQTDNLDWGLTALSTLVVVLLTISGMFYFRRNQASIVDVM